MSNIFFPGGSRNTSTTSGSGDGIDETQFALMNDSQDIQRRDKQDKANDKEDDDSHSSVSDTTAISTSVALSTSPAPAFTTTHDSVTSSPPVQEITQTSTATTTSASQSDSSSTPELSFTAGQDLTFSSPAVRSTSTSSPISEITDPNSSSQSSSPIDQNSAPSTPNLTVQSLATAPSTPSVTPSGPPLTSPATFPVSDAIPSATSGPATVAPATILVTSSGPFSADPSTSSTSSVTVGSAADDSSPNISILNTKNHLFPLAVAGIALGGLFVMIALGVLIVRLFGWNKRRRDRLIPSFLQVETMSNQHTLDEDKETQRPMIVRGEAEWDAIASTRTRNSFPDYIAYSPPVAVAVTKATARIPAATTISPARDQQRVLVTGPGDHNEAYDGAFFPTSEPLEPSSQEYIRGEASPTRSSSDGMGSPVPSFHTGRTLYPTNDTLVSSSSRRDESETTERFGLYGYPNSLQSRIVLARASSTNGP
ncbi:hypothetical protein BCR39DRAFT_587362 [Naematelia encephala]|uniref:Uncharacterized protein n=1 Tax=Naematelia encephala TaxID=71784 RepID=A0A1Y2BAS7_9TREE|nr:hypothetical protein BCR39DRAFT_587362 [Naematelia encephala]